MLATAGRFATTHWTVICSASQPDSLHAREALETLCRIYWYPVYAFVRRQGRNSDDAQDLTQEFFASLLEKNTFAFADRKRGRFRSFLLTALKNFLNKEWERGRAQKRGGGETLVALDALTAEQRYRVEPSHQLTPERLFERRWALTLLESVLTALRKEYVAAGREELFQTLKPALMGEKGFAPYAELASRFALSEGGLKTVVHRMRARYRELLYAQISHTVAGPGDVEDELRHLVSVVSTSPL
jgi:RNA polymerase sigma-70 factor (ECF subfamily)